AGSAVQRNARPARVAAKALVGVEGRARRAPHQRGRVAPDAGADEGRLPGRHETDDGSLLHRRHGARQREVPHRRAELGSQEARGIAAMRLPGSPRQPLPPPEFADASRIAAEGQKDGERNIPEMGSYTPAPFEQALIANGEQAVQQIYKAASMRIAKLRPVAEAFQRQLDEVERRIRPIAD